MMIKISNRWICLYLS